MIASLRQKGRFIRVLSSSLCLFCLGGKGGSRRDVSAVASESPAWSWPAGCVGAGAQQPSAPGSFLDHHVPQFHRMHPRPALGQQRQNLPPLNDNGRKQGLTWHCRSQGRQSMQCLGVVARTSGLCLPAWNRGMFLWPSASVHPNTLLAAPR